MSVEYVLLAGLLASVAMAALVLPEALAASMIGAGSHMDRGEASSLRDSGPTVPDVAEAPEPGPADPEDGTPSDGWSDDPWTRSHCNQGIGNGAEGCDPGNSNHNHDSNDEGDGHRGKGR